MYRIQMMDPESGLFINTNHESIHLEPLKSMLTGDEFPGGTFQIVDSRFDVHFGPVFRDRESVDPVKDFAEALGVPILSPYHVDSTGTREGVSPVGVVIILCLVCFVIVKIVRRVSN